MTVTLNHTLIPTQDKDASARFLADMLGLSVTDKTPGSPPGRFAVVKVGDVHLDFDSRENVHPQHFAFHVSETEFDEILRRLDKAGVAHSADPMHRRQGEINSNEGGRGLYFKDADGHNFELLTRI